MVGGIAPAAADAQKAVLHRAAAELPLQGMAAVESETIKVPRHKVQAGGAELLHGDGPAPLVRNDGAAGEDIQPGQHTVEQRHPHAAAFIFKLNAQGLTLVLLRLGIDRGQAGKGVLPALDAVAPIAQVAAPGAALVPQAQKRGAIVAAALDGKLLGQHVQGIGPIQARVIGVAGKAPVGILEQIVHAALAAPSVVQVQQIAVAVQLHLIRAVVGMERKGFLAFVK